MLRIRLSGRPTCLAGLPAVLGLLLCLIGITGAKSLAAQEICAPYTIQRGDTLSKIAARAQVRGGYLALFNANVAILPSPNLVEVGQVLAIPCADGSLPDLPPVVPPSPALLMPEMTTPAMPDPALPDPALLNAVTAPVTEPVTEPVVEPVTAAAPPGRALRLVAGSDYAPFTDKDLPGGGFFTQLVLRAFELGDPDLPVTFFFVNDWHAQLDSLLPLGAVDMAFPWFRPDCDRVDLLSEANARRCTDFNHSDPFYEAMIGYYTLPDSGYDNARRPDDLLGARICRPDAWFTFDLEAEGLVAPAITLTRAPTQLDCWRLLAADAVDVVTYDALPAEADARALGMLDDVVTLEALASTATLHVFVAKDNAAANAALPVLNAGLERLRLSGEWFTIVRAAIQQTIEK